MAQSTHSHHEKGQAQSKLSSMHQLQNPQWDERNGAFNSIWQSYQMKTLQLTTYSEKDLKTNSTKRNQV